jgi:hypothetical protein
MQTTFFSLRRSLYALIFSYAGIGAWITLSSSMTVKAALILAIITALPALILSSFSTVGGVAAAWASVPIFFWSIRSEAFPQGGGAPMSVVAIVFFEWPLCVAIGAIAATTASVVSKRRRGG